MLQALAWKQMGQWKNWDLIQAEWGKGTDMRQSHAQEVLKRTEYTEGTDIQEHIKLLCTWRTAVDNLSTTVMSDKTWRGIIIRSIPPSEKWLPVIPSLYSMGNTADIISTLLVHGMILGRGASKVSASGSSWNMVLAAWTSNGCTNPNCKAKKQCTHTTDNCYWPGGGKEGQFLPNFGQRAKANITMSTTVATPTPSTNTPAPVKTEHFVLSAWDSATGQSRVLIDDEMVPSTKVLISQGFQGFKKGKIPTFLGTQEPVAQCSCWGIHLLSINHYHPMLETQLKQRMVDGGEWNITYTWALHTPTLNANLISISVLDQAGLVTTFGSGKGLA